MKKSKLLAGIGIILLTSILFSCASNSAPENKPAAETSKEASDKPFGISNARYQELLDTSLVSTGNNYRMKKFIEKLRNGDTVYVAALGGSVTEGAGPANYKDGYAYQFNNKLKEAYTSNKGANVYFDGAGLSGTPSELGLVRYGSDVVDVLGHNPDLLIIEFAVNDDGQDASTRAFEAIARTALEANDETVVIALYSAATYGNTASQKKAVAEYYGLPQVNVLSLVQKATSASDFSKTDYYTDNVHPTKEGHEIQADCLMNLFAAVDAASADEAKAVPAEWKTTPAKAFTNFTRITGDDENVTITTGSFNGTDPNCQSIKKTNKSNFPQNWHSDGGKDSMIMKINCKALFFVYKEQGSWLPNKFGKAEVYVDGKLIATYNGGNPGGWCNCVPKVIIDEAEAADHTVEIKNIDGKGFTIVAMGYTK